MCLSFARAVAAIFALATGCLTAAAEDRALVIGVDHYPAITVAGRTGERDLGGAVFDARTFATLLQSQFGIAPAATHVLLDRDATRARILDEIETWLIAGTGPGDRVFLYFAGHGAAVKVEDEAAGTSRMTSAIVPADAQGDLTESPLAIHGMILGVEMHRLLDRLAGRQVTMIADSCQSGSVSRDAGHPLAIPPGVRVRTLTPAGAVGMTEASFAADVPMRHAAKLNGRLLDIEPAAIVASPEDAAPVPGPTQGWLAVWSAATTDQVTFDLPDRPGGIFTQSFADGLRDKALAGGDGPVTAAALLNFVRDKAKTFCGEAGPACSAGLTPQLLAAPTYLMAPFGASKPTASAPTGGGATAAALSSLLEHHNDFGLDVRMLPGSTLRVGQPIQIRIDAAEDGRVAVFDLTPDGDLTQLFPNARTSRTGAIRAGAPLVMPDAYWGINFKASPPAGAGALLVLVTEDGLDLSRATGLNLGFKPVAQTSRLLQVIGDTIERPVVSPVLDVPTRAPRWAFMRLPYAVVP